jgi:potassium channel subfamily K
MVSAPSFALHVTLIPSADVPSALTIGYGDLAPTNTCAKVLVFPFSILTLSLLGNGIVIIFGFIRERANQRRDKWRRRYEGATQAEANRLRPSGPLLEELALIHQIDRREEMCVHPCLASALGS